MGRSVFAFAGVVVSMLAAVRSSVAVVSVVFRRVFGFTCFIVLLFVLFCW